MKELKLVLLKKTKYIVLFLTDAFSYLLLWFAFLFSNYSESPTYYCKLAYFAG